MSFLKYIYKKINNILVIFKFNFQKSLFFFLLRYFNVKFLKITLDFLMLTLLFQFTTFNDEIKKELFNLSPRRTKIFLTNVNRKNMIK